MTISVTDNTLAIFTGNNIATQFAYTFKTFVSGDLKVKVRDLAGAETDLVLATDYTLDAVGNLGGNVVLVNAAQAWLTAGALTTGWKILISAESIFQQLANFRDLGKHGPAQFEFALDKITMALKALVGDGGEVGKAFRLPDKLLPTEFDVALPADLDTNAGAVLAVNTAKNGFEMLAGLPSSFFAPSGGIQSLGAGGTIVVALASRQHLRVQSTGGSRALNAQPFGSAPALFSDGMEIVVEGLNDANFMQLVENDGIYGFIGNGGINMKRGQLTTFIYSDNLKRFLLKSSGAW